MIEAQEWANPGARLNFPGFSHYEYPVPTLSPAGNEGVIDYLYPRNFAAESIPDLDDKVVLITGGCSGLGYEIASQSAIHHGEQIILSLLLVLTTL
jgi:hypothetical protein